MDYYIRFLSPKSQTTERIGNKLPTICLSVSYKQVLAKKSTDMATVMDRDVRPNQKKDNAYATRDICKHLASSIREMLIHIGSQLGCISSVDGDDSGWLNPKNFRNKIVVIRPFDEQFTYQFCFCSPHTNGVSPRNEQIYRERNISRLSNHAHV